MVQTMYSDSTNSVDSIPILGVTKVQPKTKKSHAEKDVEIKWAPKASAVLLLMEIKF